MSAFVGIVVRLVLFALVGWFYILVCVIPYIGPAIAYDMGAVAFEFERAWQQCPGPSPSLPVIFAFR